MRSFLLLSCLLSLVSSASVDEKYSWDPPAWYYFLVFCILVFPSLIFFGSIISAYFIIEDLEERGKLDKEEKPEPRNLWILRLRAYGPRRGVREQWDAAWEMIFNFPARYCDVLDEIQKPEEFVKQEQEKQKQARATTTGTTNTTGTTEGTKQAPKAKGGGSKEAPKGPAKVAAKVVKKEAPKDEKGPTKLKRSNPT